jgi:hypothetical protein
MPRLCDKKYDKERYGNNPDRIDSWPDDAASYICAGYASDFDRGRRQAVA